MASTVERTANIRGQQLHIRLDGREGAPWLIFSNSLATDLHLWDSQIGPLANNWRILRYDYRGHGASAASIDPICDVNVLADDLLGVIDSIGATRVCHVGVSMGSVAGAAAAIRMREKFASLVVCNSRLRSTESSSADLRRRAEIALHSGMQELVEPTLQKWFGQARLPFDRPARQQVANMIASTRPTDFAAYAKGMGNYDLEDRMAALPVKLALLAGSDDGTIQDEFRALSVRHPKMRCILIEGAGHLPNIQVPTEFNAALAHLIGK
jgi:3-oxoadipate enol-lactonase